MIQINEQRIFLLLRNRSLRRIEHAITPETNISRKEKRRGGVRAKRKGKNKREKP